MLSKTQMVAHRKAIEKLYDSICDIIVLQEIIDENGVTDFKDVTLYEKQPCRISQQSVTKTANNHMVSEVDKVINLYIAPELDIPAGSKILVTYNNRTTEYKSSSLPALYDTYQKIQLEYVGRWV